MKIFIAGLLGGLLGCLPVYAQNVNFGMNILRFNGNTLSRDVPFIARGGSQYDFRMDHTAGFEGGFYVEKTFNPTLALQAELLFRFTTIAILSKDGAAGMEWTNGGIAVPILHKFRWRGFAVMAGAELGINLLSDKTGKGAFANVQFEKNEVKDFKRMTWSGIVGVEYTTRRPGIGVHIRYSAGLTSVWNNKENPVEHPGYDYKTAKLNAWQFGLHWRFTKDGSRAKKV